MNPIAFEIGPFAVRWYGVLIASAFMIGILGTSRVAKQQGINEDYYLNTVLACIVSAIVGARLYYVLFQWAYYRTHPEEIIAIWHGGLAVHGGILAGLLALYLGGRYYRLRFWQMADIIAPFLILGQAIGRWGNFFNQEAYGFEVSKAQIPWAMYIDGAYRHPTFLYESVWNFCGFLILWGASKNRKLREGDIALLYFVYYSVGRFIVESFRTDSLMIGPLRIAQVVSIGLIALAIVLYIVRRPKAPSRTTFFKEE